MQVGNRHRLTLGGRQHQQQHQPATRSIIMLPAGWQRYLWLMLLLLYLALAVQLTVSGSGIQGHLTASHRSLKAAEANHEQVLMALHPPQHLSNSAAVTNATTSTLTGAIPPTTLGKAIFTRVGTLTLRPPPQVVESQLTINIEPQARKAEPNAPTKVLDRIKISSDTRLYKRLLEKMEQLGADSSEKKLEAAVTKCGPTVKGQPSRPILQYVQNYSYLHKPSHLCYSELLALIVVHSNAKNLVRRAAIRRTWGSLRYIGRHRIDVAFFLGRPASGDVTTSGVRGAQLQALIDEESSKYGDIVQLDYTENYRNMTIKHLAVYEWTLIYCTAARYLVKVDDDTFTDVAHLATFLSRGPPPGFYCSATSGAKPQRVRRGPKAKWTVSSAEYPDSNYPPYCEGFGYILQSESISEIYFCSLFKRFFWIDDVHVTGVLAAAAKVPLSRFWRGHSYAVMLPSQASEIIMDYIFLTAEQSEFFESVWHKLWYAVLQHSLDVNL